ncbi:D-alanyl-D-alanine carboxypeptidase/D-alanyl-D-alanine endopeptidase [Comamonas endophytica]|uniref:D-alanyl-D-alanine carboxypeptidase/D-alanyl-D-alanine-endopeptidase n=1 Tax=Comamonas endophytica TaxID=2949090 RepID=A0ABY6G7A3_9BURK|nr:MULTISPECIES: D-alanyl-D-alanine carboxypeptidase/D-alanyl-D-alanine-endopeptidase [unclassified Acidovorax]MCD2512256.1 D-alanyl-D-alanine carboxypeptidase/D-alanyl-D-alanine-endopeptidase [Acidovorax sp. D4N7]UYG50287.1 D-alanyl-D-alanine carboxypeptidase/D-alanyl-D-alanine-endopeptidase [Acidovorax sp. 5MLIR]
MSLLSILRRMRVRVLLGLSLSLALWASQAPAATPLPPAVVAALARAQLPADALSVLVVEAEGAAAPRLAWHPDRPMSPASVMKLVTTFAALDQLGPAYTWSTPFYFGGPVEAGVLRGPLYIQGQGDPRLVMERLWLALRRLQALGVRAIEGDIVLDRSAFALPAHDPGLFDGEPLRPYNVAPDALLVNYKALVMGFVPDVAAGVARIQYNPPLAGMELQPSVPLAPEGTSCGDWQMGLQAALELPTRMDFAGSYPAACGERNWAVAPVDYARFAARAIEGMWRELGGQLGGTVRDGRVPAGLEPAMVVESDPLAQIVRDINKNSSNVMTQQVLLTMGRERAGVGSWDSAQAALRQWWQQRVGSQGVLIVENGAGLSRQERVTAQGLARMLQLAWASPVMPEFLASLPVLGVDGSLRHSQTLVTGRAHLKTGTLRDVSALAGFVHAASGRRYVMVALVNDPRASVARPALEALVEWVVSDLAPL